MQLLARGDGEAPREFNSVRFLSVKASRKQPKRTSCAERSCSVCLSLVGCRCMRLGLSFPYEPEGQKFESLRRGTSALARRSQSEKRISIRDRFRSGFRNGGNARGLTNGLVEEGFTKEGVTPTRASHKADPDPLVSRVAS